jgi:hypothetical protein
MSRLAHISDFSVLSCMLELGTILLDDVYNFHTAGVWCLPLPTGGIPAPENAQPLGVISAAPWGSALILPILQLYIYLWWDPRTWQMPWESPSSMQTTWLNTLRSVVIVRWTWIWFGPGLELDILPAQFPGQLESCYLIGDFLSHMATRKWNPDNMFGSVTESLPSTVLWCEWNMCTWVHHWHASIQGSLQSRCVHALTRQRPWSPWNEFLFILNLE